MESKKKSNVVVVVIGAVLFLACVVLQKQIGRMSAGGPPSGSQGGQVTNPVMMYNGVVSQVQLVISIVMVLMGGKAGFITSAVLNVLNALSILIQMIAAKSPQSLPGMVVAVISVGIVALIYFFTSKNEKMNNELMESYQQAIETNRIMKEKDDTLQYLAYYDRLTQMPNRQMFIEDLEDEIKAGEKCTVVYVDIDNFRNINDTFGHKVGDDLLVRYSHLIENLADDEIFAAKIGGDEFGIILPEKFGREQVAEFVNKIGEAFATPMEVKGEVFTLTASYGAAMFPDDARSSEDLFRAAETAMFGAKANGKNQLCFYVKGY
ncbi:MAG: GGDEF domain-containing protein [Ruminococcus sp.]|nr:GGDEF domain-containing protein [Ruminococcus sp.]